MEKIQDNTMKNAEKYIYDNWDNVIRKNTEDNDTLIGLPFSYTVPCAEGTFQELYYWDTYFTNIGLIISNRIDIAKNNVDNMLYLVKRFGFMPNGNRTYFKYRSQPPFLSEMVKDIFEKTLDTVWLAEAYKTLKTEYDFWQGYRTTSTKLNRYFGQLKTFKESAPDICDRMGMALPDNDAECELLGQSFYSIGESGWDCSSRFTMYSQNIIPVDLNSLLYGMENNMAEFSKILKLNDTDMWLNRADKRLELMNKIMWDEKIGAFCDYDFVNQNKRTLVSTAMFYPMLFGASSKAQTKSAVKLLEKLEFKYGVSACENRNDILNLQWDYPNGWACQQYIVIKALAENGYIEDAIRIAKKYATLVEKVFEETGHLWEKYNVVTGEVSVNREYETPTMMGWSAGVYLYCIKFIEKNTI